MVSPEVEMSSAEGIKVILPCTAKAIALPHGDVSKQHLLVGGPYRKEGVGISSVLFWDELHDRCLTKGDMGQGHETTQLVNEG